MWCLNNIMLRSLDAVWIMSLVQDVLRPLATAVSRWQESIIPEFTEIVYVLCHENLTDFVKNSKAVNFVTKLWIWDKHKL